MSAAFLAFACVLHIAGLAVLVRFWFDANRWAVLFCQLMLGSYFVAIWNFFTASQSSLGGVLGFLIAGPVLGPFLVLHAANGAPAIGDPALLIGAVLGVAAIALLWRRADVRVAVLAGQIVFVLASWMAAEAIVETALRTRAAAQFPNGYCILSRASVPAMIEYGTADEFVRSTHATLVDGRDTYNWSFAEMAFTPQANPNFHEPNVSLRGWCGG